MSDSSQDEDDLDTRKIKKTVDFQRIQLEKLMKDPVIKIKNIFSPVPNSYNQKTKADSLIVLGKIRILNFDCIFLTCPRQVTVNISHQVKIIFWWNTTN